MILTVVIRYLCVLSITVPLRFVTQLKHCNFLVFSMVLLFALLLKFKAVIVLPEITQNYSNHPYDNYVSNAPVGKVITLNT